MKNLWEKLKRPIMGMAPMDGITDAAFRFIVASHGKPDVVFTEFVPVDGICACLRRSACAGRQAGAEKVLEGLIFSEIERPIVAQIFGANPENFYKVAPLLCELGFDGIDINMGCPDKAIVKLGGGAALIDNPLLAKEIVVSLKKGISDWAGGKNIDDFSLPQNIIDNIKLQSGIKNKERKIIPVSVKTRIGTKNNDIKEWAKYLTEMELANVSLHGRTLKQMYLGFADWDAIAEGAEIIKKSGASVLGNGDIKNIADGKEKSEKYGLDGILIGRAIMGNPWIFTGREVSIKEKLTGAIEHAKYYEQIFPNKLFVNMRKHLAWYCGGFHGASEARAGLMKANSAKECEKIILEVIENL